MKKLITLLLAVGILALSLCAFLGCKDQSPSSITIAVPDGGPALGMSYLMKEFPEIEGVTVTYKIVDGANGIKAAVSSGEADVALMPTNMAALLYNGGLDIKLVGTNSHGLLYLLSDDQEFTIESLKGKVLHTVGKGGTPEAVLEKVLTSNDIEWVESDTPDETGTKVALKFHDDGTTIIGGLTKGNIHYAVLGEPAVSTAIQKAKAQGITLSIVCDLQAEWKSVTGGNASYPQTALVAKGSLIESNRKLIEKIAKLTIDCAIELEKDATPYITYLKEAGATVPPTFGKEGVARTNIDPTFGTTAKAEVTAYLTILKDFKAPLIGGKLPDDGFYCENMEEIATYRSIAKAFS